jgi:hypothetical protein
MYPRLGEDAGDPARLQVKPAHRAALVQRRAGAARGRG